MNDKQDDFLNIESVYRAPNEMTAQIIRGLLESEGIPVFIKSLQIPWYDGIMTAAEGYWGDIMVTEDLAEKAKMIIKAYESKD